MVFEKLKTKFASRVAAVATAVTMLGSAGTAFAQSAGNIPLNVRPNAENSAPANNAERAPPTILRQASDYAMEYPVVTIAIYKGKKDDKITGEQIGEILATKLRELDVPSRYFIAEGGDYTSIAYNVATREYGPYGLNQSLGAIAWVSRDYDAVVKPYADNWPARVAEMKRNETLRYNASRSSGVIADVSPRGQD